MTGPSLAEGLRDVYWIGGGSCACWSAGAGRRTGRRTGPDVIAQSFRLLPRLVQPLLADPGHAVWLLPAPGFRRAAFESRGSLLRFWQRTSDPDRALRNLLERDRMFTGRLREEADRLALPVIEVDTATTEDDLVRGWRRRSASNRELASGTARGRFHDREGLGTARPVL